MNSMPTKYKSIGLLVLLEVLIVFISLYAFMSQSITLDEATTLWLSAHSIPVIVKLSFASAQPFLYNVLLNIWRHIIGGDLLTARLFSLIFLMFSLPVLYFTARDSFGKKAAYFVSIIFALSPFLNWYGSEALGYSMLLFFSLLNQYFFLKMIKGKKGHWVGYVVTAILGTLVHYFFFLAIFAQIIFLIISVKKIPEAILKKAMGTALALFVLIFPLFVEMYRISAATLTSQSSVAVSSYSFFETLARFVFGFQGIHTTSTLVALWPLTVLFAFLALRMNRIPSKEAVYFLVATLAPIGIAFVIGFIEPSIIGPQFILAVPSLYLFLSWVIMTYPDTLSKIFRGIIIAAMVIALFIETYSANLPVKENYEAAASFLDITAGPQDIILTATPDILYPMQYYYTGIASLEAASTSLMDLNASSTKTVLPPDVANHQTLWLLVRTVNDEQNNLKEYFDYHYATTFEKQFSPDLSVYAYRITY